MPDTIKPAEIADIFRQTGAFLEGHCGRMDKQEPVAALADESPAIPTLTFSSDLKAASA